MEELNEKILKYVNMPFIAWLLSPLAILFVGTFLGAKKVSFQFYPFLLLYLFLLLTKGMEIVFFKNSSGTLSIPKSIPYIFYPVLIILLTLILVATNWIVAALLALYSFFIILSFYKEIKMEDTEYYLLLQIFFQTFIVGLISYYLQAGFISAQLLPYFLPTLFLMIPITINQQERLLATQGMKKHYSPYQNLLIEKNMILNMISFIVGIVIIFALFNINTVLIWKQILFFSVLLLYLLPLTIRYFRNKLRQDLYIANFVCVITILFSVLLNISI